MTDTLPEPFQWSMPFEPPALLGEGFTMRASLDRGSRCISFTQLTPGKVGACQYAMMWIVAREDRMLAGEVTDCYANRRMTEHGPREGFTDKARDEIRTRVMGAINRYGFDKLWNEQRRAQESENWAIREAETASRWLSAARAKIVLTELDRAGQIELRRIPDDPTGRCNTTTLGFESGRECHIPVVAQAWCNGEHVGFLGADSQMVPLLHVP